MRLREDSDPYCLLWIGLLLLGSYYANFGYMMWTSASAAADFLISVNFFYILLLLAFPPLMALLFTGYLRPSHGKAKMSMLGPSVISALFFVIVSNLVSLNTDILGNLIFFSGWGIGSSLLIAGGLSIMQTLRQSTSPGILDVASLHYGPPKSVPEPVVEEILTSETVKSDDTRSEVN
ncbi:hypothetical protein EU527_07390 [Candidatus Thorarchaeota archaeon]|nr:MAG: hypothetical protein EU527_07390 [Candidatus Thorarchaeota archaeon]